MRITKIEQQKKNTSRYSVFVDDLFAFGIAGDDILFFGLEEGKELSSNKFEYLQQNLAADKARKAALKYLSYGDRTRKQLEDKLLSCGYTPEAISDTIEMLMEGNLINDYNYCERFIESRLRLKPAGRKFIFYELLQKGIEKDIITEALNDADLHEEENAYTILEKRLGYLDEISPKDKKRAFDYLVRRGFSYGAIKSAFTMLECEESDDD